MTQKYYFACSYPLENGSVVKPGNWARMLKLYTPAAGNPWVLLREKIYEEVRLANFNEKPSRFESLFLCASEDDLVNFIRSNQRNMDIPYEVELVQENPNIHKGCLIVQNIEQTDNHAKMEEKARIYWSGENIQMPEFVTTSPIKIIRQLSV